MSIREVLEMPSSLKKSLKESDRDKVFADFNEALEKHIEVFEFEGDYNFKTLSQKAKEVARRKVFYRFYADAAKKVKEALKDEFPHEYIIANGYTYYEDYFFKVKNIKEEDRIHVYASIDYEFINALYDRLLADTRRYYKRKAEESDL